jgi:IclR family KDG regulon transcriptional repressor
MPSRKPKSDYVIQTVVNALRLLEEFREANELGVTELSHSLELHKNNVFRLLATLEQRGYIEQIAANERYRLGARCLELGDAFYRSHPLLECARPVLRELAEAAGETAHLGVMARFEVVHLDAVEWPQPILTASRLGWRLPVHCTALGKVLLGCSSEDERESFDRTIVAGGALEARTPQTITDALKYFEHIRTVAGQGFALDVEECEPGMSCAAAPVHDRSGRVIAALSVSGPSYRLDTERLLDEIVPAVTAAAVRLSQRMGYESH